MGDKLKIVAGFAVIYLLWGGTFLAIRVGDRSLPPLSLAAARFLLAGGLVYGWCLWRGVAQPTRREWGSLGLIAAVMFLIGYGILFWAETRVTSGVAAVLASTIPLWVAVLETWVLRQARRNGRVMAGCCLGALGVAVLMAGGAGASNGSNTFAALSLLVAALAWAAGTVMMQRLPLPRSVAMSAAGQMLIGGALLGLAAALSGQTRLLPGSGWAGAISLSYLVLAGSVLGYSVYVWLLERVEAVKVSSYALVNPVVALGIGAMWAGEKLSWATAAGSAIILLALGLVLGRKKKEVSLSRA